jgi:hypothetical protein
MRTEDEGLTTAETAALLAIAPLESSGIYFGTTKRASG